MVNVKIDDVEFRIKQEHDFSWLCSLGRESFTDSESPLAMRSAGFVVVIVI